MKKHFKIVHLIKLQVLILLHLSAIAYATICDSGPCGPGQYLSSDTHICLPCQVGTFMNHSQHNCSSCYRCYKPIQAENEITLGPCTSQSDTVAGCKSGYFLRPEAHADSPFSCERCGQCKEGEMVIKKCSNFTDTKCGR
ncbi:unnamed protein product, partial [Lymnaea stagnalis]